MGARGEWESFGKKMLLGTQYTDQEKEKKERVKKIKGLSQCSGEYVYKLK